jgi:hypothetical protein
VVRESVWVRLDCLYNARAFNPMPEIERKDDIFLGAALDAGNRKPYRREASLLTEVNLTFSYIDSGLSEALENAAAKAREQIKRAWHPVEKTSVFSVHLALRLAFENAGINVSDTIPS